MKLLLSLLVLSLISVESQALSLEYFAETSIPTGTKFQKTTIGGLSAISFSNGTLTALSDDKGRAGDPRFYEFDLTITSDKKVTLTPKAVRFVTGLPMDGDRKAMLDPEGLVRLSSGDLIISSEGNSDAKPRAMPRIFRTSPEGLWKSDFPMPDKFLPEATGVETKGIQGNLAFESLTTWNDGQYIFTTTEAALTQDLVNGKEAEGDTVRILKFEDQKDKGYAPIAEYAYHIDAFNVLPAGKEVMRGVSEMLALSETKMLVMERGVRVLGPKKWAQTVAIYLADLSKAQSVHESSKLEAGTFQPVDKVKLVDFETDLVQVRGEKVIQNYEAMAWGPNLPDGRRSLLVMVDNNFSKAELTEFIVFAVDGE
ncbi:esterase-like activity of phytase family protein [Bdellovibrio bacteriovorus]|uniref:esterase-like activity of phytase family protein n=1 Tax=Bdellovibrio bacteriovorus TaxID=959 RepID=UPI0035A59CC7